MAVRQYIGARYVPKFYEGSTGTEWESNVAYEPLTIVTVNGNSYTSKIYVPAAVGSPIDNPDYWVATGNYSSQINALQNTVNAIQAFVAPLESVTITEEAGSDITDALTDAFAAGKSVILDGKDYNVASSFTIPTNQLLIGNGSVLTYTGAALTSYFITVGTNYNDSKLTNSKNTGIYNLTVDCDKKINGILINTMGVNLDTVSVYDPISVGIDILPYDTYSAPADAVLENCKVYCSDGFTYCGLRVNGTDNNIHDFRTMFTQIGVHITSKGGGTYITNSHPLGIGSVNAAYSDSVAFKLDAAAVLRDCYSDNFRYGVYADTTALVVIDGFQYELYESVDASIRRYGIYISGKCTYNITNLIMPRLANFYKLKMFDVESWVPNDLWHVNSAPSGVAGLNYDPNDDLNFAMLNGNELHRMSTPNMTGTGNIQWLFAMRALGTPGVCWAGLDAEFDEFYIKDLWLKFNSATSAITFGTPVLKGAGLSTNLSVTITRAYKDGVIYVGITREGGYNAHALVTGKGNAFIYLPSDGITLTDYTSVGTSTYQINA